MFCSNLTNEETMIQRGLETWVMEPGFKSIHSLSLESVLFTTPLMFATTTNYQVHRWGVEADLRYIQNWVAGKTGMTRERMALTGCLTWLECQSHTPKGFSFNPQSGCIREATDQCFSLTLISLSLSLSLSPLLSLPLSLISINISLDEDYF